jgi:uncharacterized membrane protein
LTDPRPPASSSRRLWIVIVVLLLVAIVVPLWVPLYDKVDPRLNGWPFFYWFQMALILGATAITMVAFALSQIADRKHREDRERTRGDQR